MATDTEAVTPPALEAAAPALEAAAPAREAATSIREAAAPAREAATVMKLLPAPARLLTLHEPTDSEDTSLTRRNDLFRRLVAQEGLRTIAVEGDCVRGTVVDDYVTAGTGTLDEAMEYGFGHGSGAPEADRELLRWMRAHNERRPAADRLRFAGIGAPLENTGATSPRQALTALHGHLAARMDADLLPCTAARLDRLLGADGRWTDPAALADPARSVGQSADAMELRMLADDLEALLDACPPHPADAGARDDWDRARLYARTATGLLRRHYWMADTSPGRMTRLVGLCDQMRAADLLALAERGPALVYAHNRPLRAPRRGTPTMRMSDLPLGWWSAGAMVGACLGEE